MVFTLLVAGCGGGVDHGATNQTAPTALNYRDTVVVYAQGVAIIPNVPSSSGGGITQYTVSPALPAELILDPQTGIINGTPSQAQAKTHFTVTGSNSAGSVTTQIAIEVSMQVQPPTGLSYLHPMTVYTTGMPIVDNTPQSTGGEITHFSISG